MPKLGEVLKERREARGITLADISEATRIGTRFLKAIETDNFSALPGGIFTRSFIRAYARQIGMNEDEAVALYQQQVGPPGEQAEEGPAQEARIPEQQNGGKMRRLLPFIGLVLAVAAIIIAAVFLFRSNNRDAGGSGARDSPQPAIVEVPNRPPPAPAEPSRPADNSKIDSLTVRVEATRGECWISYQVDDGPRAAMLLRKDEAKDLPPASTQVVLMIGIRLNLDLKINGRPAAFPPDTPNFAARVVISRDNLSSFFQ
jgi:cytoskeletal protein RodZ